METMISVQDGDILAALRGFFRTLFEKDLVEALFIPLEANGGVLPALVTDPDKLGAADPLTPLMPINSARAISALTGKTAPARLGAVLRPCEMRALIELVKLQQASLENLILIGLDCPGTYEVPEFIERQRTGGFDLAGYLDAAKEGRDPQIDGLSLRPACRMCDKPVPGQADIHIHLFGSDTSQGIPVRLENDLANQLGYSECAANGKNNITEKLTTSRGQARQQELAALQQRLASDTGFAELFATCIRCHNCMTVCPVCYCKTCLFKTAAFDHQPEHYLNAARRKGAIRMLGDTLLFHLTRLNHMSVSCVSCGMCTSACPSDIPVGVIFSAVGAQVQAAFDYVPGRDVAESLPLITFQANEWMEVGEAR